LASKPGNVSSPLLNAAAWVGSLVSGTPLIEFCSLFMMASEMIPQSAKYGVREGE
jgi:hypothetical protein